jgi:hypothetical protein
MIDCLVKRKASRDSLLIVSVFERILGQGLRFLHLCNEMHFTFQIRNLKSEISNSLIGLFHDSKRFVRSCLTLRDLESYTELPSLAMMTK